MQGLTEKAILHRFDTMYGIMCDGDDEWEEMDFKGPPTALPARVYNVRICVDGTNEDDHKLDQKSGMNVHLWDEDFT